MSAAPSPRLTGFPRAFAILGSISASETFARGRAIRELPRLVRVYGRARRRKRKGIATIRLPNGLLRRAELHWYEAAAFGRKEFKIKRYLDDRP